MRWERGIARCILQTDGLDRRVCYVRGLRSDRKMRKVAKFARLRKGNCISSDARTLKPRP
jgi:hypothetical protein